LKPIVDQNPVENKNKLDIVYRDAKERLEKEVKFPSINSFSRNKINEKLTEIMLIDQLNPEIKSAKEHTQERKDFLVASLEVAKINFWSLENWITFLNLYAAYTLILVIFTWMCGLSYPSFFEMEIPVGFVFFTVFQAFGFSIGRRELKWKSEIVTLVLLSFLFLSLSVYYYIFHLNVTINPFPNIYVLITYLVLVSAIFLTYRYIRKRNLEKLNRFLENYPFLIKYSSSIHQFNSPK
jgi:hypothetical protein